MAKLAVLVGCNYPGTTHELHGCHNNVSDMRDVLTTRFGFDKNDIQLMRDKPGSPIMPTASNVKKALTTMVDKAGEGDVLFFHYSGHGSLIMPHGVEAIVPCDMNPITSVDMRHIVNRVPKGATFTILSDSCHTGGLIDKETEQIGPSPSPIESFIVANTDTSNKAVTSQYLLDYLTSKTGITSTDIGTQLHQLFGVDAGRLFHRQGSKPLKEDQGILISGCGQNESCIDGAIMDGNGKKRACGAFTNAVLMVLKVKPDPISNRELVMFVREFLMDENVNNAHPCLYCSDESADALFLGS